MARLEAQQIIGHAPIGVPTRSEWEAARGGG